jgi:hypothetical protein
VSDNLERERVAGIALGTVTCLGVGFAIMASYAGLNRTIWWFGLTAGSATVGILTMWLADKIGHDDNVFGLVIRLTSFLFIGMAGLLLLFGILVITKIVASPFWSNSSSSYSEEELPESWRR